ncbi:hypothetical protein SSTU70S_01375 [Stutzerimonas stutzeri]
MRAVIKSHCDMKAIGYRPTLPRVLGIDELYLNRQFRCVLTDIERGTILDILESRQYPVLYNYLANMQGRENVQIVCQDMWKPYRDVASQLFPKAAIVVDRFHIQRMANEAMETLRKGLKKELTQHQRRQLKGDRKMMLMRRRDLNPMQELIIHTWLDQFPELGMAYKLKEAFFDIWEATTEAEARARYQEWLNAIPEGHKSHWKTADYLDDELGAGVFLVLRPSPAQHQRLHRVDQPADARPEQGRQGHVVRDVPGQDAVQPGAQGEHAQAEAGVTFRWLRTPHGAGHVQHPDLRPRRFHRGRSQGHPGRPVGRPSTRPPISASGVREVL